MKSLVAFAPLLLISLTWATSAQAAAEKENGRQMVVITGLGGDPACDGGKAQRLDIRVLTRDVRHLLKRCVSVAGIISGRMLFNNPHDALTYSMADDMAHASKRLGVYASPDLLKTFPADMSRVILVGNVGDCDELTHREGVLMVSGYCHYSTGAYIAVSSVRIDP